MSPCRAWHAADGIRPGDAVIAVLDPDLCSVLVRVAIVGQNGDVDNRRARLGADILMSFLNWCRCFPVACRAVVIARTAVSA